MFNLLNKLSIRTRTSISTLLFIGTICFAVYTAHTEANEDVNFAQQELYGVELARPLIGAAKDLVSIKLALEDSNPQLQKDAALRVSEYMGQTDKSIQDIEKVIKEMMSASEGVVGSLTGIRESVDKIFASSTTVASAVEEQSAVVNDIAQSMNIAAHKTQAVKETMLSASQLAGDAEKDSQQVLSASQDLSRQAEQLREEVDKFLAEVRAG
jgi:hypothetical protein